MVASKPRTRLASRPTGFAFSRRSYTACPTRIGKDRSRIFFQIRSANSSTVFDSAVERLKSSLVASGDSSSSECRGQDRLRRCSRHLAAVAQYVEWILTLEHFLHKVWHDVAHGQFDVARQHRPF